MESSDRVSVSAVTALFLHHVFIHLILSYEALFAAQSELICSHQPTIALPGVDVILSCHLEPPISASSETVEWTRPGLDPEFVHVYKDGRLLHHIQNPSYNFRTRLFVDELEHGNVSMKIFSVKLSDEGTYRCFIPSVQKEASVQLLVGESDSKLQSDTFSLTKGLI
ncbi:butyrophilin-like protein 2 [Lates japonicus]